MANKLIVSIKFRGKEAESAYMVNGYSVNDGIVKLFTYRDETSTKLKIQIFPLIDIEEIAISEVTI